MPIYYVKPDSDNKFPDKDTTPVLEPADDLRAVNIPTTSVQYFTRYWWMYAFKSDDSQEVTAPGNLPNLDIDYLQGLIDKEGETIQGLQTALGSATKAQVEAQQQFVTTQEQFQKQFVSLSQQIVAVQKQIAAKAE
ncbi:hypothetical protein ABB39_08470 [Levilactobacillus brevis]|uniref:hypothetical protein n=1 Tax=Levilactobacillus brevis TaxID=1580 RepID=UPI00076031B9|nr:hypothetical protein [Levilactobacillus brevis]KWT47446.1 hypothetical protein ABB39_08470 [Levilactobacillus brevis]MDM7552612.1 hypothetical protein [Levilactobacillus brevis]MDM7649359.1 hypothetical protein [Levilactobacillus brevis]QWK86906.1 hypothetical protein KKI45_07820 [Levilactobacillus brevis]TOY85712.1 hypothetical protein DIS15_02695 [Levilactobacillus brevis]